MRMESGILAISVVIVNYNGRKFLNACLTSLRKALKGIRSEIVVVDNNSRDGSKEWLQGLAGEYIVILNDENAGFSRACNQAIAKSKGRYILFLNPDTTVGEGTLHALVGFMEGAAGQKAGAVGPTVVSVDGTFQRQCARALPQPSSAFAHLFPWLGRWFSVGPPGHYLCFDTPPKEPTLVECLSGSAMMVRREVFQKIGFLDEAFFLYGEDMDLCKRMQDSGVGVWFVPTPSVIHFGGGSSEGRSWRSTLEFHRAARTYFRKHFVGDRRIPTLFQIVVIVGIWVRCGLDMLGLLLGTRRQVGGLKPRTLIAK